MNAATEFITVMLTVQGIPADVAEAAAKLIHAKSDELTLSSEKSLTLLIDAFIAVYLQDPARALEVLEAKLV